MALVAASIRMTTMILNVGLKHLDRSRGAVIGTHVSLGIFAASPKRTKDDKPRERCAGEWVPCGRRGGGSRRCLVLLLRSEFVCARHLLSSHIKTARLFQV